VTDSTLFALHSNASHRDVHATTLAAVNDGSQRLSQQAFAPTEPNALRQSTDTNSKNTSDQSQNTIEKIVGVLETLPGSFELSKAQFSLALAQAGVDKDPQVAAILDGVTKVIKNGDHVELQRDAVRHIPLNQDVVKNLVSIKSVDLGTLKFDLALNGEPKRISNISGLDLTFSAFGNDRSVQVQEAELSHDQAGNSVITGMVENPITPTVRNVLDIGDKIPVTIKLTKNGDFIAPLASTVLRSAADTTGQSLPGLVLHDELSDAADVAKFAEKYPKWMSDTVTPVLTGLEKVVEENQNKKPKPTKNGASLPSIPNDATVPAGSGKNFTELNRASADHVEHGGEYDKTIKVDGVDRHYILHVPPNYDGKKPMPMIVALHGMGGNSADFEHRSNLNATADKEGFIVAYPDSTQWFGQKDWKTWDTDNGIIPPGQHSDDIKFLRAVIDDTQSQANVDDKRIFMAGISNGGMMTFHAAAALSDKIAAIAVVSGAMSGKEQSPTQPISVLNIHGTNDTVIPIGGIEGVPDSLTQLGIPTFKSNSYVAQYWNTKDGITGEPTRETDGKETKDHYINPKNGAEVEQIVVAGGEHTPDNVQKTMDTVVQFFEKHPKIASTSDNIPPANDPPRDLHKPVDPVDRLIADVKKRGVSGIESDVDRSLAAVPSIDDGSISPAELYKKIDATIHLNFNDPITGFIRGTDSMSKHGEHIELKRSNAATVPINFEVPGTSGLVNLKDIEIGNASFDLRNRNGLFSLDNLQGLRIKTSVWGHDLTSDVKEVKESKLPDGNHLYSIKISHPLPSFARFVLMQPDNISVNVELDAQGNPKVTNQKQIMDDALGRNPVVRGTIDEITDLGKAFSHPSLGSVGNALKDVAITGGATALAGPLGFLGAQAIVHEFDS
jgi:polyhydroxybutyrate depolymerase